MTSRDPQSSMLPPHPGPPPLERARVADVMNPGVMTCTPDTPIRTLARTMSTYRIHALVVAGIQTRARAEQFVWRVVSDRDLLRAFDDGAGATASEICTERVTPVEPDVPLTEAARAMQAARTSHLVVVDHGWPVGVVSTFELAGAIGSAGA